MLYLLIWYFGIFNLHRRRFTLSIRAINCCKQYASQREHARGTDSDLFTHLFYDFTTLWLNQTVESLIDLTPFRNTLEMTSLRSTVTWLMTYIDRKAEFWGLFNSNIAKYHLPITSVAIA